MGQLPAAQGLLVVKCWMVQDSEGRMTLKIKQRASGNQRDDANQAKTRVPLSECGALFELGQVVATPGAIEAMEEAGNHPAQFLSRHVLGNWGDELGLEDRQANERALCDGSRIFSVYKTNKGDKLYVITEARGDDRRRSSTCLLLPEEY